MKLKLRFGIIFATILLFTFTAHAAVFSDDPKAIEQKAKSVLMLEVYNKDNEFIAAGSGFVAFNNRTIVTNFHVIEDGTWMLAKSDDGYQYMVTKVLTTDEEKDIAICEFMSPTDLLPLELNTDGELLRAEKVVAIGNPLGIELGMTNTVSIGNISALYEDRIKKWIQFTAPISNGSSGGALFDDHGKVIGMTSATFTDGQNMNLAIHISEIQELYDEWDGESANIGDYLLNQNAILAPSPTLFLTPSPTPKPTSTPNPPTSTPTLIPKDYPTLAKGDKGEGVKKLQEALIRYGYLNSKADGVFGSKTQEAVAMFNTEQFGYHFDFASSATQNLIFNGELKDPDICLYFKAGFKPEWHASSSNELKIRFQVASKARQKTVTAFSLHVYATDKRGKRVHGESIVVNCGTKTEIAPGATGYSNYITFSERRKIHKIHCGIYKIEYSDGSTYTVPSVHYKSWIIH